MSAIFETKLEGIEPIKKGKVREIYEIDDYLLIVASDRVSAFDVVMTRPIPEKGKILNLISAFWFNKTNHIIANHLISTYVTKYPAALAPYAEQLEGRSMLVQKAEPLPVEFIVRGYIAGSGWKEYKKSGTICSIPLPNGLIEFDRLPNPIFTPSTKADEGHDENIDFAKAAEILGLETANMLRDKAIALYTFGRDYLESKNIILADTKFEFGRLPSGEIILIDEVLTPDSSRFWLREEYAPGKPQINFDKQILRDYLESISWNKQPPPPELPDSVAEGTYRKYKEAFDRITG
ncbi:MAG: Phosphoribosylaminoimidazole-succinocarboxamide synthase [Ignavibacteria bacterium]|nr:Phosphoribosylaminoimidazole-succinocarboxamide synthase [Ignavibacteria bacterium]